MKRRVIQLTESDLHRIVKESVNSIVTEVLKSDKLRKWARENGGFMKSGLGKNGVSSYYNEYDIPLSDLTDDMLDDELKDPEVWGNFDLKHVPESSFVQFGNGKYVPIKRGAEAENLQKQYRHRPRYRKRNYYGDETGIADTESSKILHNKMDTWKWLNGLKQYRDDLTSGGRYNFDKRVDMERDDINNMYRKYRNGSKPTVNSLDNGKEYPYRFKTKNGGELL